MSAAELQSILWWALAAYVVGLFAFDAFLNRKRSRHDR